MAESILNIYGDHLVSTTGGHGAEIASQRLDELDKEALHQVLAPSQSIKRCVDLGCGFGWQSIRFAMLGCSVHLFDLLPESDLLRCFTTRSGLSISYRSGDLRHLKKPDIPPDIDIAFSQRFFHYLTFEEAVAIVQLFAARLVRGAYFYISASGLNSELGHGYPCFNSDIKSRFAKLSPEMQLKHNILEPVCLYTEAELSVLMSSSDLLPQKVWTSPFGNIKGVYKKNG